MSTPTQNNVMNPVLSAEDEKRLARNARRRAKYRPKSVREYVSSRLQLKQLLDSTPDDVKTRVWNEWKDLCAAAEKNYSAELRQSMIKFRDEHSNLMIAMCVFRWNPNDSQASC